MIYISASPQLRRLCSPLGGSTLCNDVTVKDCDWSTWWERLLEADIDSFLNRPIYVVKITKEYFLCEDP